jgi:hypothetical protein
VLQGDRGEEVAIRRNRAPAVEKGWQVATRAISAWTPYFDPGIAHQAFLPDFERFRSAGVPPLGSDPGEVPLSASHVLPQVLLSQDRYQIWYVAVPWPWVLHLVIDPTRMLIPLATEAGL